MWHFSSINLSGLGKPDRLDEVFNWDLWLNLDGERGVVDIDYLAPLELGGGCLVINTGLCPVLFIAPLWGWMIVSLLQGMIG